MLLSACKPKGSQTVKPLRGSR